MIPVYLIFCRYTPAGRWLDKIYLHMVSLDEQIAHEYCERFSDNDCRLFVRELLVDELRDNFQYYKGDWGRP